MNQPMPIMTLPTRRTRKRRGFTLTELAIVLGVIGTILSAIWMASARVSASNKTQKAAKQIQMIVAGYQSLWAQKGMDVGVGGGWTDATCLGITNGYFSPDMIVPGTTCPAGTLTPTTYPTTPWGGTSQVQIFVLQPQNTLNIRYYNIPSSACIQLSNAVYNTTMQGQAIGKADFSIWHPQYTAPAPGQTVQPPFTSAQISTYCTLSDPASWEVWVTGQ